MNRRTFLLELTGVAAIFSGAMMVDRLLHGALPAPTMTPAAVPGLVKVKVFGPDGKLTEIESPRVIKTDEAWKKQLTAEQYQVARAKGTEPAFCGIFYDNHKTGTYHCVCCALPLFASGTKFDSGTGWPSFFQPIAPENVTTRTDNSWGMERTEILCTRCDGHLGHVFDDGPPPTGLRYCLNSASLTFIAEGQEVPESLPAKATA